MAVGIDTLADEGARRRRDWRFNIVAAREPFELLLRQRRGLAPAFPAVHCFRVDAEQLRQFGLRDLQFFADAARERLRSLGFALAQQIRFSPL